MDKTNNTKQVFVRCLSCRKIQRTSPLRRKGICDLCLRTGYENLFKTVTATLVEIFDKNDICLLCFEKKIDQKCPKCTPENGKIIYNET